MDLKLIKNETERIVELLVKGDYKTLLKLDSNNKLTEDEIKRIILDYGGILTMPPKEAYDTVGIIEIDFQKEVLIHFDLWIDNERSDLTLIYEFLKIDDHTYVFGIEDIHVL